MVASPKEVCNDVQQSAGEEARVDQLMVTQQSLPWFYTQFNQETLD